MIENTFGKNIIPANDQERLAGLARYRIMDTPKEESFDNIARLCTQIFNVPIALVSLVDTDRVFFKANIGMGSASEANRGKSLCALAVLDPEVTVFEDALQEPCLVANPNVAGNFGLRFYAGAPLITPDGLLIGTLCIIDKKPRIFTGEEANILKGLSKTIMDQLELRLLAMEEITYQLSENLAVLKEQQQIKKINKDLGSSLEELKIARDELAESHEHTVSNEIRLIGLIEHSPIATAMLKGNALVIDSANKRMLEIWGKDEGVIGKPLLEALPEMEGQAFPTILEDVFKTGKTYHVEEALLLIQKSGEKVETYVNFTYQPVIEDGKTTEIMIVAVDVTEQVVSRKLIEETNTRLEIAMDASKLGSTEVVIATGIMTSTAQFKANYGYAENEEFTYTDLFNSMFPEYRERVKGLVRTAMETNGVYKTDYPIRWRDGSVHWISAHGRPRYDKDGKADRMVGMTADITEQKLFQQQKDDFLSIASHELKTPITSLKASLQLLDRIKDKPHSAMHIKLIEQSNRAVEKMNSLVDELLHLNRVGEGQLQLTKRDFKVVEMLELSCNHVRVDDEYQLVIQGDKELAIHADEHRIDQVIVNLVNNAIKYAPQSKEIYLVVDSVENMARISVTDKGPGIPKEKLSQLFDRYFRINHDGKNYSGLGLGLYIASEIVKQHGGEIGVESTLGIGSTFWFTVPLAD